MKNKKLFRVGLYHDKELKHRQVKILVILLFIY